MGLIWRVDSFVMRMVPRGRNPWAYGGLLALMAARAFADTVPTKAGVVTVLGLSHGMIEVEDGRKVVTRLSPGCAGVIALTAFPQVAEAEQAYLDKQNKKAISLYGEALKNIEDAPLQQMVQLRLMRALDADGQLVEATRVFLEVYAGQPVAEVAAMHPVNLPEEGSKALAQAAALVEAASSAKGLNAAQARPLKLLLLDIYLKAGDDRAGALAHELSGTTAAVPEAGAGAARDKLAKAAALEAAKKYDDACLAYMAVAAEFPNAAAAPTALLAAARLQKGVRNQPDEAARLARRIVEGYPNSPEAVAAKQMFP